MTDADRSRDGDASASDTHSRDTASSGGAGDCTVRELDSGEIAHRPDPDHGIDDGELDYKAVPDYGIGTDIDDGEFGYGDIDQPASLASEDSAPIEPSAEVSRAFELQDGRERVSTEYASVEADGKRPLTPEEAVGIRDPALDANPAAPKAETESTFEGRDNMASPTPDTAPPGEAPGRGSALDASPDVDVAEVAKASLEARETAGEQLGGRPIERADLWHEQGQNDLGFQGTCGLASTAAVLKDCGVATSENEIVHEANATNRCENGLPSVEDNGGVAGGTDMAELMREHGVEAQIHYPETSEALAGWVEQGHGVIAEVSAAELWDGTGGPQIDASLTPDCHLAADHAVVVTGTIRTDRGDLTGFVVNDTGRPDGAAVQVPIDVFERAWNNDRQHEVVVTTLPTSTHETGR